LHSQDLIHWQYLGGALLPLENPSASSYWAPEVLPHQNALYMYYSASIGASDEFHRLRVAVAPHPAGPFADAGGILLPDAGFTIDASPFVDPLTGRAFLFFATDYESDAPHGTGLAVVPLSPDLLSVQGDPACVVRAQADWQIYERNRPYKGKVWNKWHCVEGPHCVFHNGKYYCLYSGGAWRSSEYGVGFAVADHPLGPWRDPAAHLGPSVLKADPPRVLGPGHASIVAGPDGKSQYLVYHAWNQTKTARCMCVDPLRWTESGPVADGPSTTPRELT
jgi:beta-xylosidase